ncbi:ABC transporter C family member 3 [Camellia lanceoleosa]|uniref:ABC transporter C family member 3 n=1 Tax=Camellia lanceoleosa TaxID=1840588 RepID=A0ACC0I8C1_9ERIC|nr:ABC transporter C family member 3 [Camellia lanceoleosa]
MPVILLCQVIFQGLQMGSNCWLTWAVEEPGRVSNGKMLRIFVSLSAGGSIFMLGRMVLLSSIALNTAQNLFVGMITLIFRASMSFFDSTPSSQIRNRSSTDQSTMDTNIPYRLAGLAFALIQLFSIIILMCMVSWQLPLLFLLILVISVWYQVLRKCYLKETARQDQRLLDAPDSRESIPGLLRSSSSSSEMSNRSFSSICPILPGIGKKGKVPKLEISILKQAPLT